MFAFDLPDRDGLAIGAMREPFAPVTISGSGEEVVAGSPVRIGWLATGLQFATHGLVDEQSVEIAGMAARLDSMDSAGLLSGEAHRFAVETGAVETGEGWEIMAARDAELIGEGHYLLSGLLRGLHGTEHTAPIASGARVVHLGAGVKTLPIGDDQIGQGVSLTAAASGRSATITHDYLAAHLRPWSPVYLSASRQAGRIHTNWIRRSRAPDNWQGLDIPLGEEREVYLVELIAEGEVVSSTEVTTPTADIVDIPAATHLRVRQGSQVYGWGRAGIVTIG